MNIEMPRDGRKFSSPFRFDKSPSCTVKGDVFTDWSTGEHLDQIDFFAAAKGIPGPEAIRDLARIFQIVGDLPARLPVPPRQADTDERKTKAQKREAWAALETPSRGEIRLIAELRGLSPEGVQLAADRGLLWCADSREGRSWVLTDSRRINAQGRLLSGAKWAAGMKSKTLPGSEAAWPVGLRETSDFRAIVLVEGGPDLLAGLHLAWCADAEDCIAVVAILGAGNRIPDQALPAFAGKNVRIFPDADEPGQKAGQRWARQLAEAGVAVSGFSFAGLVQSDGSPVKDLNDFCHLDPNQWEGERERIESAFNFSTCRAPAQRN
ncbi:MAG: hypothetical protein WCQ16_06860 [Verrucomicrobiae bacterium]